MDVLMRIPMRFNLSWLARVNEAMGRLSQCVQFVWPEPVL